MNKEKAIDVLQKQNTVIMGGEFTQIKAALTLGIEALELLVKSYQTKSRIINTLLPSETDE